MTSPAEPKASELVNTLQLKQFRELSPLDQISQLEQCDRLLKSKHCDRTTKRQLVCYLEVLTGCDVGDDARAKAQAILTQWK